MSNIFATAAASAAASLPAVPGVRAAIMRDIERQWSTIQVRAALALGADGNALDAVTRPASILGGSHKADVASAAAGALVSVSYLAPGAMLAKYAGADVLATLCAMADLNDCEHGCLGGDNGRGQLAMAAGSARRAQLGRTILLLGAPALFAALLAADCKRHAAKAAKAGLPAYVRLDGTSDLGMAAAALERLEAYGCRPYDYTKLPGRAANNAERYAVTFSATPRTIRAARAVLGSGGTVAVVVDAGFRGKGGAAAAAAHPALAALAREFGATILEGDASEPLEPAGATIRALTAKAGTAAAHRELVASGLVF